MSRFPFKLTIRRSFTRSFVTARSKLKILVTADIPNEGNDFLEKAVKEDNTIELIRFDSMKRSRKELLSAVNGIHGLYCLLTNKIDKELLDAAGSQLKVVSTMSVGYDHIDIKECSKRGVLVGNTPGVLTDAMGDLTVGLLLATARRFPEAWLAPKEGTWGTWDPKWMCGMELAGSTVGIVGLGRIGAAVAERLVGFKIGRLLYTGGQKGHRDLKFPPLTAEYIQDFYKLLGLSDIVIATCALTEQTQNLFNKKAFSSMKKTAIFINTSRGGVVDQDALVHALKEGQIRAAGLDVTTPEPIPKSHPLLSLPNCVILPHIGSATDKTRGLMARLAAENVIAGVKGKPLVHPVNEIQARL